MVFVLLILVFLALFTAILGRRATQTIITWSVLFVTSWATVKFTSDWASVSLLSNIRMCAAFALLFWLIGATARYGAVYVTLGGDENASERQIEGALGVGTVAFCLVVMFLGFILCTWGGHPKSASVNPQRQYTLPAAAPESQFQLRRPDGTALPDPTSEMPSFRDKRPLDFSLQGADPSRAFAPNGN